MALVYKTDEEVRAARALVASGDLTASRRQEVITAIADYQKSVFERNIAPKASEKITPPAAKPAKRLVRISDLQYLGTKLKKETVFDILPDGREVFAETRYRKENGVLVTLDELQAAKQPKKKAVKKQAVPKSQPAKTSAPSKTVPKKAAPKPAAKKPPPKPPRKISGGERLADWERRAARMKDKTPPEFRKRPITKPAQLRPYEVRTRRGTASTLSRAQLKVRADAAMRRTMKSTDGWERVRREAAKRYQDGQKRVMKEQRRQQAAQRKIARDRARSKALSESRKKVRTAMRKSRHDSLYAALKEARRTRFNKGVPLPLAIKALQKGAAVSGRRGLSDTSAKRLAPFGTDHRKIVKELGWKKRSLAGFVGRKMMYPSMDHAANSVPYVREMGVRFMDSFGAAVSTPATEPRLSFYEKMSAGVLSGGGGLAIRVDATDVIENLTVTFPRNIRTAIAAASDTIGRKLLDIVEPYVPKDTGALYSSGRTEASGGASFGQLTASGTESFGVTISYNTPYAETVYFNENNAHGTDYNAKYGTSEKGPKETARWVEKAFENEKGALNGLMREFGQLVFSGMGVGAKGGKR